VCGDSETTFYPQRDICYADMERAAAAWKYERLHGDESSRRFHDGTFKNWSRERSAAFPYAHDDGVTIWVATEDLNPDDNFLDGGDRPSPSDANQST
jgi:hypothetical protein